MTEAELRASLDPAVGQPPYPTYGPVGPRAAVGVGVVTLTAPLVLSNRAECGLSGAGAFAAKLAYQGDATRPAVRFEGVTHGELSGLYIDASHGARAAVELGTLPQGAPSNWISTECKIANLQVDARNCNTGVSVNSFADNGRTGNNEFHRFTGVTVAGAVTAGFHVRGGQAHRLKYTDCNVMGGKYGHWFEYGSHFVIEHQQYTAVETCVKLGSFWISGRLSNCRAESCRKVWEGTEGSPMPVTIEHVDADLTPQANDVVISHVGSGPVVLRNLLLAATNGNPFRVGLYTYTPGSVRIEGMTLRWHNPANGDTPQKGVILGPLHQLAPGSDTSYTEEILWPNGTRSYRVVPIRPADDAARGRQPLPQLEGLYTPPVQWPPEPGTWKRFPNPTPPHHPAVKPRSWAVAFDWTPQALYGRGYNQHLNVLQANGVNLRLDWLSAGEYQLRAEGTGISQNVGPLVVGQTYRIAFTWDRDEGKTALRIDGTVKAGGPGPAARTQPEVGGGVTADWSVGGPVVQAAQYGGRQWATIANAVWYDRALSTTELAAC